jgi:SAM-dependent methyltransferase
MHGAEKAAAYQRQRRTHWDAVSTSVGGIGWCGRGYHRRLAQVFQHLVPAGRNVIEFGCGRGDLLAALKPALGVGVDLSAEMLRMARLRHPGIQFAQGDVHSRQVCSPFDYIILSDLVNDLWDVQAALQSVRALAHERTRLIINTHSRLWELPLRAAGALGFANRKLQQNWLTVGDTTNLLTLAGWEVVRSWPEVLWPLRTPLVDDLCNRVLVRLPLLRHLALTNMLVCRPSPSSLPQRPPPTVSVLIPARNEAGNMANILDRIPSLGAGVEVIIVEGNSHDGTYDAAQAAIASHATLRCSLIRQPGKGKGDAVREGFRRAQGDVLMILDADMTVAPEDLPRFLEALASGRCEFANGVRLVYPMERHAMRLANTIGNKFFGAAFAWLLGQPIRDTLCGTKALWRRDYEQIAAGRAHFGDFDPFGDFDLLFGAAKLNLKILDMPIRYHDRTYGATNIQRWRHGLILMRMLLFAGWKLKFV